MKPIWEDVISASQQREGPLGRKALLGRGFSIFCPSSSVRQKQLPGGGDREVTTERARQVSLPWAGCQSLIIIEASANGHFLKAPGRVPGVLHELHHQDFPSFPGNTVDDVTTFCRKRPGLREVAMLVPKHTASKERKGTFWSSFLSASSERVPSPHPSSSMCASH